MWNNTGGWQGGPAGGGGGQWPIQQHHYANVPHDSGK